MGRTVEEDLKNQDSKDEEIPEVYFEGELISALEELKKSRKKNKYLQD